MTFGAFLVGAGSASADSNYTVQPGDTLSKIAKNFDTTVDTLAADNNIANVNLIIAGETLKVTNNEKTGNVVVEVPTPQPQVEQPKIVQQTQQTNGDAGYAASQIAAKTGTSVETWSYIIERESGGNANIRNASSGAYGYFQLLGHGEHDGMSVDEQVNMAVDVYNAQGFSAWEVTH